MGRVVKERLENLPEGHSSRPQATPYAAQSGEEYPSVKSLKGSDIRSVFDIVSGDAVATHRTM